MLYDSSDNGTWRKLSTCGTAGPEIKHLLIMRWHTKGGIREDLRIRATRAGSIIRCLPCRTNRLVHLPPRLKWSQHENKMMTSSCQALVATRLSRRTRSGIRVAGGPGQSRLVGGSQRRLRKISSFPEHKASSALRAGAFRAVIANAEKQVKQK